MAARSPFSIAAAIAVSVALGGSVHTALVRATAPKAKRKQRSDYWRVNTAPPEKMARRAARWRKAGLIRPLKSEAA